MTDWRSLHGDSFQGRTVLITGGTGFIGSHIAQACIALGASVTVLDDLSGSSVDNLDSFREQAGDRLRFVEGSILDTDALDQCCRDVDYVFHQGALPSVPRSIEHPVMFNEVNVTGTVNVLEAARRAHVRRVMFAASSSAYGDSPTLPKVETMPPLPKSPYAANKLAGEHLMRAYASCYDIDTVSLRYFNIFGPRQNANSVYSGVIAIFAKRLINGEPVTINGEGFSRDFTYVDNAVHANLLAARCDRPLKGEVFNVACGKAVTIFDLAVTMARALGKAHLQPIVGPERAGDVKHSLADISAAGRAFGYEPIVEFEPGLEQTMAWYQAALVP